MKIYGREPADLMEDFDVTVAIWRIFMSATLKAAVHLGNDHDVTLRHVKNSFWSSAGLLLGETEKLISGQTETTGISLTNSEEDIDKLTAQSSLSVRQCQGLCLFRLDAVCVCEKWDTILLSPGRIKFSGIQKLIISN